MTLFSLGALEVVTIDDDSSGRYSFATSHHREVPPVTLYTASKTHTHTHTHTNIATVFLYSLVQYPALLPFFFRGRNLFLPGARYSTRSSWDHPAAMSGVRSFSDVLSLFFFNHSLIRVSKLFDIIIAFLYTGEFSTRQLLAPAR